MTRAAARVTLGSSFASNLAGVAWTAAMLLAFTPLFIRLVGVEGYGLIGFYATLQALLQVLDFGFAPTINRWLSRYSAGREDADQARDMSKTLEAGSWLIAVVVGALLIALSATVARLWMHEDGLGSSTLRLSLILMACTITAQLPTTYYQSGLLGLRQPFAMNAAKAVAATASTAGAAFVLVTISQSVQSYFAVQAGVALLHALLLRTMFWRALGRSDRPARFRVDALRVAWRFTAGMTLIATCAAVVTQVDRIILSRMVPLREFGYYALAWVVAGGLAVVTLPALNTLFPRFSGLFASNDDASLREAYHTGAQALSVLLLPLASVVILFAHPLLAAWTGNAELAFQAAPLAVWLTAGMALNGLMYPSYALQLAAGATRLALVLTVGQIVVIVPLVIILGLRYGVVGAAVAWFVTNALYLVFGSTATFSRLLPGAGVEWILRDVLVPLCAAGGFAVLVSAVVPLPASRTGTIALVGLVFMLSALASALVTRSTRTAILNMVSAS